jgi:L-alanine-DL-glutamate epimerase-like enolase superfamily enzyme
MRITGIETFAVGAAWKNWLFVKVHTDEGLYGIGEGTLNGFIRTTEAGVRELEHLVIGEDPLRVRALAKRLLDSVSLDGGHPPHCHRGNRDCLLGHPRQIAGRPDPSAPWRESARQHPRLR